MIINTKQRSNSKQQFKQPSKQIYQENILEHYRHPHHFGSLQERTSSAKILNPLCGDEFEVDLEMKNEKVKDASFHGKGCAISTAAASMLLDTLQGKSVSDLQKLCSKDVLDLLGIDLGPSRMKCALLVLDCIRKAVDEETH